MGRLSLDVETATREKEVRGELVEKEQDRSGGKDLHNAVWCLRLDLEVGGSGMVEILVEELVGGVRTSISTGPLGDRERFLTSFAGLAMSLKGTGIPDMTTTVAEEYEVGKEELEARTDS
jgi:hypothetical protein